MIHFKNVTMMYTNGAKTTKALENINLDIQEGEFVFILGSSGAGKSSLLKLIRREAIATEGEVEVNGYMLREIKKREIPFFRRTMGVVFQDFRLIPDMSVYENVAFALRVTGVPSRTIRRVVPYMLGLVGLSHRARYLPDEISGGEQQRTALARALVNNPKLIIADEPTGNIDKTLSSEIMELLKATNSQGTTVLIVTHDTALVSKFGGRVITIENGRITSDEVRGKA